MRNFKTSFVLVALILSTGSLTGCAGFAQGFIEFAQAAGEAQRNVDAMNQGPGYINNPKRMCSPAMGAPPGTLICR
jgi:hypothetical protein